MNATLKKYLLHLLVVALVAVLTAVVSGPVVPVTGGSVFVLLARQLLSVLE